MASSAPSTRRPASHGASKASCAASHTPNRFRKPQEVTRGFFWASFWNIIWFFISAFIFIAYLMAFFGILADLFKDRELSGGWKAFWLVALLFVPFPTALMHLIVRGKSTAKRSHESVVETARATEDYIRTAAYVSPSDEIAKAKALLDAGTITAEEYEQLKRRALGAVEATMSQP